ncbi:MAG TPA: PRC-barrel domain-containing protein [Hypericibacter adhaerens]|nr:PRC-barrel domain-containing protein [Hypericibacter adhaerens]HWA41588.1 PRC-barrel domain-containing protein [Hypericibacter adhaerens]
MKRVPLLLASGAMLMASGAVWADSATTPSVPAPPVESQTSAAPVAATGEVGANQLVGVDIRNANDEKVAEIKDVLIGNDNTVDTAIVNVGGVMGMAGRNVAVAWNQIQFFRDADTIKAKTSLTEDQLKALPEYTSDGGVWHTK